MNVGKVGAGESTQEDTAGTAPGLDNSFTLQKLEVLCAVVAAGGVGKAAEELYVSQPVVSAHLRSLEQRLGTRLFVKDGRGIRLSEAGERTHRWALEVLRGRRELAQTLHQISEGTAGSVSIAASMSAANSLLTPILVGFREAHRDVRMTMTNASVEVALDMVQSGRADFCVVATDSVLDSHAYRAELIGEPPFALVTAGQDTSLPDVLSPDELADLPYITPPGGLAIRRSQEAALARVGVKHRRVELELGSAESIKQAVSAGLGVALLWRVSTEAERARGELREILISTPLMRDKLYFVTRSGKRLTAAQRLLKERILDEVPRLLET